MQQWPMLLSVEVFSKHTDRAPECHSPAPSSSQPLPSKVHPNPLLSDSRVFWYKGWEKIAALFLEGTSRPSCLPRFWGVLMSLAHFPLTGLSGIFHSFVSDLSLASSHHDQMYSASIFQWTKGILLKILNNKALTLMDTESFLSDSWCLSKNNKNKKGD